MMKTKRFLAAFLTVAMLVGMLPMAAFAEDNPHAAHSSYITHIEAVAGNCTTPGNIEFWYCDYYACEKCYSDEAMTQEISPADVVITPGVHSDACVGCEYSKSEKTFSKFVPSEHPNYDATEYSNNGFWALASYLKGSTFLFAGQSGDGRLYAMGNETNPDGSRQAVDITDKVNGDGTVTVDSDTAEFFAFEATQYSYVFSPDNGYMTVLDGKIAVHGENIHNIENAYTTFSQPIGFEQNTELSDYAADKGYLYGWSLNSRLILFDDSGAEPKFSTALMWSEDEEGNYIRDENGNVIDNRAHTVMLYRVDCDHSQMEHVPYKAATCEEDGNVEYWYCDNCGKNFANAEATKTLSRTVIYALDHDWEDWKVITPATQEEDGTKQRICKNDNTHTEEETYHFTTYVPAIPSTCTGMGSVEHWYCEQCWMYYTDDCEGDYLYEEQLAAPATGHKFNAEGICEYCTMKRNVYTQVSTLAQFDSLPEDAYYLIVFKDGDKTYAACLPEENPYWVDSNNDHDFDLFVIDENENGIPDCIETADMDDNGTLDYLEDQDFDEEIGTYNDHFRVYEALAYAKDEEIYAADNFVEITVAADGSITVVDEGAMEFQMMKAGVWGGAPFAEEDLAYDAQINNIDLETERIRAAWVPNYWVANSGMMGYYSEDSLMMQNRRYGDENYPGVLDNKNWKISFNEDGTACLVSTWESFEDTGALQFAKYTNAEGEADMTVVGLPDYLWEDSPIMQNRTALLPACLYASVPVYDHTCVWGEWVADETGRTHTRTCKDSACGKTETENHSWDAGVQNGTPTCTQGAQILYTCAVCGATRTEAVGELGHDWGDWTYGSVDSHIRTCKRNCGAEEQSEGHSWGEWTAHDGSTHRLTCSVCHGYQEAAHAWDNGVETEPPTCTETGIKTYTCGTCDHTKTEDIPIIDHSWGEWVTNKLDEANTHIRYCSCNESQTAPHSFDAGVVTEQPTHTSKGIKTYTCAGCGYSYDEELPATTEHAWSAWSPNSDGTHSRSCLCNASETEAHSWSEWVLHDDGSHKRECPVCQCSETMILEADKPVNTTPVTNIAGAALVNTDIELIGSVLTDEEQSQLAGGSTVEIYLVVEDISEEVPAADKIAAEEVAQDSQIGMYLDIDLFKKVETTETQVTETNGMMTITIEIPESLRNQNASVIRTYNIIRVHTEADGSLVTDVIEATFDPENNTLTFQTDKFSTYALAYTDTSAVQTGDLDSNGKVNEDDAIYLLQHVLSADIFPVNQPVDYDGDGNVDEDDAIRLLWHVLMPESFPL